MIFEKNLKLLVLSNVALLYSNLGKSCLYKRRTNLEWLFIQCSGLGKEFRLLCFRKWPPTFIVLSISGRFYPFLSNFCIYKTIYILHINNIHIYIVIYMSYFYEKNINPFLPISVGCAPCPRMSAAHLWRWDPKIARFHRRSNPPGVIAVRTFDRSLPEASICGKKIRTNHQKRLRL